MFYAATGFNQPLNNWDVSKVTDMSKMFYRSSAFNQPLENWNVSNVRDMHGMFYATRNFNQNLNGWNVSKVTNMSDMFNFAKAFNQPLDNWNVKNVEDMSYMFSNTLVFNQDLRSWKTKIEKCRIYHHFFSSSHLDEEFIPFPVCVICTEIINYNSITRSACCCHVYHQQCLNRYIQSKHERREAVTCPLCRCSGNRKPTNQDCDQYENSNTTAMFGGSFKKGGAKRIKKRKPTNTKKSKKSRRC